MVVLILTLVKWSKSEVVPSMVVHVLALGRLRQGGSLEPRSSRLAT